MVLLSYLGHAYVWGGLRPATILPARLAVPGTTSPKTSADHPFSATPATPFTTIRLRRPREIECGNIGLIQNFLGGIDEEWFILIRVDIERKAASALTYRDAVSTPLQFTVEQNKALLEIMAIRRRATLGRNMHIDRVNRPAVSLPDGRIVVGVAHNPEMQGIACHPACAATGFRRRSSAGIATVSRSSLDIFLLLVSSALVNFLLMEAERSLFTGCLPKDASRQMEEDAEENRKSRDQERGRTKRATGRISPVHLRSLKILGPEEAVQTSAWCPRGDLNPHAAFAAADFKSAVSADSTTRAPASSYPTQQPASCPDTEPPASFLRTSTNA